MDWINILETIGIPCAVALAFGYFIWKQQNFIQRELVEDLDERFSRLEGILIKLIDQQKKMQIEQKGIERSFKTLIRIMAELSGNGLRDRFLRMEDKGKD